MENIDVNFPAAPHPHFNRHQVLQKYTTALRQLRNLAENFQVRPFYFDNYVLFQYFQQRSNSGGSGDDASEIRTGNYSPPFLLSFFKWELLNHILNRRRQILYWLFYIMLVILCFFAYRHHGTLDGVYSSASTSSSSSIEAERIGMQSFVYPSMRIWRRMTLPLIQRFPRLTELYDMHCLMENPFFQMEDLSCEPCVYVQNVLDLTQVESASLHSSKGAGVDSGKSKETSDFVPFVFKINQHPIQLNDFYEIFINNHEIFLRDAYRVQSTNREVTNLDELFNQFNQTYKQQQTQTSPPPPDRPDGFQQPQKQQQHHQSQTHNMWRCNRMLPARLLRQLFASPTSRPGIALERYMAIDTPGAPAYKLPDTQCANVYVQQALGSRFIILRPTSECRHRCRTISMRLPQSFVLSYNWWYWKPISAPDPVSDSLSITLIGSYC